MNLQIVGDNKAGRDMGEALRTLKLDAGVRDVRTFS